MESTPLNTEIMSGDAQTIFKAGQKIAGLNLHEINGVPVAVVSKDSNLNILTELLDRPRRIKKKVEVTTAQSFIDYFEKFSSDSSMITCDIENATFKAVLDYHDANKPDNCEHTLVYSCEPTEEYRAWTRNNGKKMTQIEFARFIEDNLEEIIKPEGAQMLEIAQTLKANTKTSFVSGTSLANGQTQLQYMESIDGSAGKKGEFKIPELIKLGMLIFEGDNEGYPFEARFRYRIHEGTLTMWYDLIRPHKQYRDAVEHIHQQISKQSKCQLTIHGSV